MTNQIVYKMKSIIKANLYFFIPLVLLWLLLFIAIFIVEKTALHLMLNSFHTNGLDVFFRFYTEVGGFLPFVVAAGLLFYKFGAAIMVLVTQLLVSVPVQVLKRTIDADRPKLFFEKLQLAFPQVEGVHLHANHSFPSGHTAAAFALFLCLTVLVSKRAYKFLFFLLAVGAGFSRIYLSQHFAADVLAGSVVGVLVSYLYLTYHQKISVSWFDKSLLSWAGK